MNRLALSYDWLKEIDINTIVGAVLLDFSAAFWYY
jgi:hypothetical protein